MATDESTSAWIEGLKANQPTAIEKLWERYSERLVGLARSKLGNAPKAVADEDDIATDVFHSLWRGAQEGRFDDLHHRDQLWWLFVTITQQKVVDHYRRETALKRGNGQVVSMEDLSTDQGIERLISTEPTPELLAVMDEEYRRLLNLSKDETHRKIAAWRFEGYTVEEIAKRLDVSSRTVERKLKIIRKQWGLDLSDEE